MFILSLGIKCCDTIVISAEGEDAKEAVEALEEAALKEED
jgi:phosphotransferase system HPr-like phosphotransfer protein